MFDNQGSLFFGGISFFVKTVCVFLHAFVLALLGSKGIAKKMRKHFVSGHPITKFLPEHQFKKGTPSMGGLAIVAGIIIPTFFWATSSPPLLCAYAVIVIFSCIGAFDDVTKLWQKNNRGISAHVKFFLQICGGLAAVFGIMSNAPPHMEPHTLHIPIFIDWGLNTPYVYCPFALLTILSTCNAVNLTDGLDGLAVRTVSPCFLLVAVLAFFASHADLAQMCSIPYIPFAQDITILAIAACGACTGFLWFNKPKAALFMGDTGSMALGAVLAFCFLSIKLELLLPFAGFIILFETLSVILQIASLRLRKKKLFLFTPFHHHLERKGWSEVTVVFRLGTLSMICCLLTLLLFLLHAYVNTFPS